MWQEWASTARAAGCPRATDRAHSPDAVKTENILLARPGLLLCLCLHSGWCATTLDRSNCTGALGVNSATNSRTCSVARHIFGVISQYSYSRSHQLLTFFVIFATIVSSTVVANTQTKALSGTTEHYFRGRSGGLAERLLWKEKECDKKKRPIQSILVSLVISFYENVTAPVLH
jgi:hypothetical protein